MAERNQPKTQERASLDHEKAPLPEGWVWKKLGESCTIILGQSPESSTYNTDGEGMPFFQGKAEFGDRFPSTAKWCTAPKKVAKKNDILISVRAPVGPTNIAPEECCIGRGLAALRPSDRIDRLYLLHYLRSIERQLSEMGTGTTFKAISGDILRSIEIPLAPPDQQIPIVAEIEKQFSRLDEAVAGLKRIKANLKRYKAAVLKAAVEGKLTEEWRQRQKEEGRKVETGEQLLKRILAERKKKWEEKNPGKKYKEPVGPDTSNLAELPQGWVWASLEMVADALGGYAFQSKQFTDTGHQVVKMANIKMETLDLSQHASFITDVSNEVVEKYSLIEGDILVTLTGTRKKRDYGYIVRVTTPHHTLLLNQRIARLRPYLKNLSEYIAVALQGEEYRNRFFSYETGNVGQGNVGMKAVTVEALPIPPLLEQAEMITGYERAISVANATEREIDTNFKRAERLRQGILKEAFCGNLLGLSSRHKAVSTSEKTG